MITTYLRSSSIGALKLCEMQFYLTYVLGLEAKAGKAAAKGNVVHKSMELLAWQSYYRARGISEFDEESFGRLRTEDITPDLATEMSYGLYKQIESHVKWNDRYDLPECIEWTRRALLWTDGYFDPRNQIVIQPEQKFDLVIDEPWARYEYDTPEGRFEGQLSIKGTMDLIVQDKHDIDEIECIDYKTGRRKDWGIEDEVEAIKDWRTLMRDSQLLLYYLACRRLYPEKKAVHFTILFINSYQYEDERGRKVTVPGGPFRMSFDRDSEAEAMAMLREKFEAIKATQKPEAKRGKPCFTFCPFGRNSKNPPDPSRTTCDYYHDQVRKKGADQVFYEIGSMKSLMRYGSGGGRQAAE